MRFETAPRARFGKRRRLRLGAALLAGPLWLVAGTPAAAQDEAEPPQPDAEQAAEAEGNAIIVSARLRAP